MIRFARVDRMLLWVVCTIPALTLVGCAELLTVDSQSLLASRFSRSEILGFLAGLGTTFAALPDIVAMLRKKSAQGMNPRIAAITGTFQILWVWYGLLIGSRPVVMWNIIAVLTNAFCVGAYLYFSRATLRESNTAVRKG